MPFSDYQDCGEKILISKCPKSDEFALNLSVQAVKLDIPACMNATLHFFCREVFFPAYVRMPYNVLYALTPISEIITRFFY